ncbi:MAG: hypothetical protein LBH47_02955 [Christensenellaceae bacterium]|jgi:aspartokinase|nr:hypothetical protein [Christensenellaceae bacterium]
MKVVKFGGTSMGNKRAVLRCVKIVKSDSRRKLIVVSAPHNVTNQLFEFADRFENLTDKDYIVSRGEYFSAKLMAQLLNFNFIDAKDVIEINKNRTINLTKTKRNLAKIKLPAVIGGFYGVNGGRYELLTRGGSDYTGAVLAMLFHAKVYEKFTDVDGIYDENKKTISQMSYKMLAAFPVVHKNAIKLLETANIPMEIRNTFDIRKAGTRVCTQHPPIK